MRLKNKLKLRLNIAIAAFAAMLAAGTAFAFASGEPLVFDGRANVDAALLVGIDTAEIVHRVQDASLRPPGNTWNITAGTPISGHPVFTKTLTLDALLFGHENSRFEVYIQNLGSMAAFVDIESWTFDNFDHVYIEHSWTPDALEVGERRRVYLDFRFDAASVTDCMFNETINFNLTLNYTSTP